jgi:hypothetical protein
VNSKGAILANAEFKTSVSSNLLTGIGLAVLSIGGVYWVTHTTEADLLNSHSRKGGIVKLIEQIIGWDLFVILIISLAVLGLAYAVVSCWKAVDKKPDVSVFDDHLEFHPAVRMSPAGFDEISHWSAKKEEDNFEMKIHFRESFWSLQNIVSRSFIKLQGKDPEISGILDFFDQHPLLSQMFVDWDRQ